MATPRRGWLGALRGASDLIFFTVGTQLPFDRFAAVVEQFALKHPALEVLGQVGPTSLRFKGVNAQEFLEHDDYSDAISRAQVVLAHAGTGTIMAARKRGKPIIVLPRRAALREARSDHQVSTCRALEGEAGLHILQDPEQLESVLLAVLAQERSGASRWLEVSKEPHSHSALAEFVIREVRSVPARNGSLTAHRVLACSSTGGHFTELLELLPRDGSTDVLLATTSANDRLLCQPLRHFCLRENSRWSPLRALLGALEAVALVARTRPDVVLSTGASPGFLCALAGWLTGARVIWVDSFANADQVSLAGRLIGPLATLFCVQWPHLSSQRRVYEGRVA